MPRSLWPCASGRRTAGARGAAVAMAMEMGLLLLRAAGPLTLCYTHGINMCINMCVEDSCSDVRNRNLASQMSLASWCLLMNPQSEFQTGRLL